MAYKIVLRDELAKEDENGVGFEYEIKEVPNNPERVRVCFEDKDGNWREINYRKSDVETFIEKGQWIRVTA